MKKILYFALMTVIIIGAILEALQGDAAMTTLCCTAYLVTYMEARNERN